MSSSMQSQSAVDRSSEVWRSVVAPTAYQRQSCTSPNNASAALFSDKHISYATMAPRHDALTQPSHLSGHLHMAALKQPETARKIDDASPQPQHSSGSRSGCDASLNRVTSPQRNNIFPLKERKMTQKPSIELKRTNSNLKKPPILSPKPSIALKPKAFAELSPNAVEDSVRKEGEKRSKLNNSVAPQRAKRILTKSQKDLGEPSLYRGRSQSVEEDPLEIRNVQVQNSSLNDTNISTVRSQTLPRRGGNNDAKLPMMEKTVINKVSEFNEKLSFKSPPQVAAKPKLKTLKPVEGKRKVARDAGTSNALSDHPIAPFSDMRTKFEEMQIKFKKPVPDAEFKANETKPKSNSSNVSNELFKDILQMKSLDEFAEQTNETVSNQSPCHNAMKTDDEGPKMKNNTPQSNMWFRDRPIVEKAISKPTSTTSRASDNGLINGNIYNPSDVPAPISPQRSDLQKIDFTDLPPPPDLPPVPDDDLSIHRSISPDDDKHWTTAREERNALIHESTVLHHRDKEAIASGSAQQDKMYTYTPRKSLKLSENIADTRKVLRQTVKIENHSSEAYQREANREPFGRNKTIPKPSNSRNSGLEEVETREITTNATSPASRNIDEEILYYDNMDIMEKVKQKREQDEIRLRELNQRQEDYSLSSKRHLESKTKNVKSKSTSNNPSRRNGAENQSGPSISKREDFAENLNNESVKVKPSLETDKVKDAPPKLPPKQRKFNRQQANENAHKHVEPQTTFTSEVKKQSKVNPLQLHIKVSAQQPTPHVSTPMPSQTPHFDSLTLVEEKEAPVNNLQPLHQPTQPLVSMQQFSPEDARARQLVDEPLAPILEEDSTYGDSSSCTSSILGDDPSVATDDDSSIGTQQKSQFSSMFQTKQNVSHQKSSNEDDGGTSESGSTLAGLEQQPSSDDISETSSVQWQENPLQANRSKQAFDGVSDRSGSISSSSRESQLKDKSDSNDDDRRSDPMPSGVKERNSQERLVSESSGASSRNSGGHRPNMSRVVDETVEDVEPYGMVDLSKLQPTFSEIQSSDSRPISTVPEQKLTPSSIMHYVNQFNANQPTSPNKSKHFNLEGESIDMPTFPLDVNLDKQIKAKGIKPPLPHQRTSSLSNQTSPPINEPPGYDNLENYGGAAREEAEREREEALQSGQSIRSVQDLPEKKKIERDGSRDSLSSEPGLAKQAAGSRASFPLPSGGSQLARHSSAVRAVDRHSGNLKRAKELGAANSFKKASNSRQIEKNQTNSNQTLVRDQDWSSNDHQGNKNQQIISGKDKLVLHQRSSSDVGRSDVSIRGDQTSITNNQQTATSTSYNPPSSHYNKEIDDEATNPYEEVPFLLSNSTQIQSSKPETSEQAEAKTKVREMLENIKPPESPYRPKPPMPRYPVDYDNFYLGKKSTTNQSSGQVQSKNKTSEQTSSPLSSPNTNSRFFSHSDVPASPCSTPSSVHTAPHTLTKPTSLDTSDTIQDEDVNDGSSSCNTPDASGRSLSSQLRYILGGGQDSKHKSPSIRRKRSLLKRSKSPGGSRRSKSPSKSMTGDSQSIASEEAQQSSKESCNDDVKTNQSEKLSDAESHDPVPVRRSASQRIVDRIGRSAPQKTIPQDESSEQTLERRKKGPADRLRMSSRWRRSKSQDRESPTRSKSKERKIFGRRSKSQERPKEEEYKSKDIDIGEEENGSRRSLRRSRSSSRKRDKRGRSSDRNEDGSSSGGRGRNPVRFIKKLLRKKPSEDNIEIIHSTFEKAGELSDSTEALSTILAYKTDEASEKEEWNPPRPTPPQQKTNKFNDKAKSSPSNKRYKALKSPPSHRAKKFSLVSNKTRHELSTGSSSEGIDKKKTDKVPVTPGNPGTNRNYPSIPSKLVRNSSRTNSFSNSIPSSDSEQSNKHEVNKIKAEKLSVVREQLNSHNNEIPLKAGIRRNILLNREYDSDTATSVLPSDADSSAGPQSDLESSSSLRSALKPGKIPNKLVGTKVEAPKRPVRVLSPQRSKSDPSIFVAPVPTSDSENKNTYYNIEDTAPSPSNGVEKKRPTKPSARKRRDPKQNRRQTAPVDLAYEAHQRQKYKTLVSLNAQTLRKVTEKWLSEWRNQLPVGGFLITSWSDVALASHRPICMIANSVVYSAVSTGNKRFQLACQLYDYADIDERMTRKLDNCSSLPAHPNTCGVCSHFNCRVPRSLLDPSSGGGAADAVCVVLTTRPSQSLQEFLDATVRRGDPAEFHRQLLFNSLQLLQGINHLQSSGFQLPNISAEHLVITEERGFLQILPHLHCSEQRRSRKFDKDTSQSSDSDCNVASQHKLSITQQVGRLIGAFLHGGNSKLPYGHISDRPIGSSYVVPGTKYSDALKHVTEYMGLTPGLGVTEAAQIVQCALWGPDDLDDVGVDDVSPYAALELWIEMEQAKLVNSLAVLASNERLAPLSFLKHQFFATVSPQPLFNGLKVLQRI